MSNQISNQNFPIARPEWIEAYAASNPMEANMLVGLLQSAGLEAGLRGPGMAGALGEVPVDALITRIFVPAEQRAQARDILHHYETATPDEWQCSACGELNGGSFELCWQCGTDRP
ncbi:MAG: DUF2007 domain-containing protein [Idiomarina sp.]|nr:DUF2007 domain-containing protein [Idiomarina sp.]